MFRIVLGLLLVGLVVTPLGAGGRCVRNRAVFGCFRGRVVAKRVVAVKQAVVAVPVAVQPDYYFSTASYYRDQLLADAVAYRVLIGLRVTLNGSAKPGPVTPPKAGDMPGVADEEEAKVAPPARAGDLTALTKVVSANCLKCHGNGPVKGGLDLRDLSKVSQLQRERSFRLVTSGAMPKGGEPLKDEEVKLFYDWAEGSPSK